MASVRKVGDRMEQFAMRCYEAHRMAFECWNYGGIDKAWADGDGILCIRYDSGDWWHYAVEDGLVVWW
ncbi:MAG: hypothetical protein HFH62_11100 [Lachnospiraceae bacterium]|nr:hypothetical protein [Lachnospiraceae bacterium]